MLVVGSMVYVVDAKNAQWHDICLMLLNIHAAREQRSLHVTLIVELPLLREAQILRENLDLDDCLDVETRLPMEAKGLPVSSIERFLLALNPA